MKASLILVCFFFFDGEAFQLGAGTSKQTVARAAVNSSTTGCADGTREGFTDLTAFPDIAACEADVHLYHIASAPGCADGWRVCTGQDVWDMNIQATDALAFNGRYAYNSNNDGGMCFPECCTNGCSASESINGVSGNDVLGATHPTLAGMGKTNTNKGWSTDCVRGGRRIDVGNGGCTITQQGISGVVCCRDPSAQTVNAVGDPHLQNVYGQRFDLFKGGKHVLIKIPRGARSSHPLLLVQADARALGAECADMYFQEVNITGDWAEAKQVGGYHYSVSQHDAEAPEWVAFGKVHVKVVHGRTNTGLLYLNVYVKHLRRAGMAIGGLLGEDDHEDVSIATQACAKEVALFGSKGGRASKTPYAVASFE